MSLDMDIGVLVGGGRCRAPVSRPILPCEPHPSQAIQSQTRPYAAKSEVVRRRRAPGRNACMIRYGAQFGPDITFLGVDAVDLGDAAALAQADVVVIGAP